MSQPLAYFLTWTTYGTWLHGDERGSVDTVTNRLGAPRLEISRRRVEEMRLQMMQPSFVLDEQSRDIVEQAISDHCEIRRWERLALNVRTNHVHVVVKAHPETPEVVMKELKSWGTRRLVLHGVIERGRRVWTDHGSTRWIDTPESLQRALEYVMREQ